MFRQHAHEGETEQAHRLAVRVAGRQPHLRCLFRGLRRIESDKPGLALLAIIADIEHGILAATGAACAERRGRRPGQRRVGNTQRLGRHLAHAHAIERDTPGHGARVTTVEHRPDETARLAHGVDRRADVVIGDGVFDRADTVAPGADIDGQEDLIESVRLAQAVVPDTDGGLLGTVTREVQVEKVALVLLRLARKILQYVHDGATGW